MKYLYTINEKHLNKHLRIVKPSSTKIKMSNKTIDQQQLVFMIMAASRKSGKCFDSRLRCDKTKGGSIIGVNRSLLRHELVIEGLKSPLQGIFIQTFKTQSIKSSASRLTAFSSPVVFLPQTKARKKIPV